MDQKGKDSAAGLKSFGAGLRRYPERLIRALVGLSPPCGGEVYLAGGTVRDWLLDRPVADLDLVVRSGAGDCCRLLRAALGGGTLVPLGGRKDDVARLVWKGLILDISGFREGAQGIDEDLMLRDFTVNAMAVRLADLVDPVDLANPGAEGVLIDPLGGLDDLRQGRLQVCGRAFLDDPLRLLRGYRLRALLGFTFTGDTQAALAACGHLITRAAAERIGHELDLIMESERAHPAFKDMAESGILWHIIPELQPGCGLKQPGFHHLDVFQHGLQALACMEEILRQPGRYFAGMEQELSGSLAVLGKKKKLKWSALLHDVGKPFTQGEHTRDQGRITFYNHDRIGKDILLTIGRRLRWSNEMSAEVGMLVEMHMHPFHLCNVRRTAPISSRACLKIWKKAGDDLAGLFLLAMADSLACQGEQKPAGMEEELAELYRQVQQTIDMAVKPVAMGPRLVTGDDLKERFHLSPGPVFAAILEALETVRVEGQVQSREEALAWVGRFIEQEVTGTDRG
jgi:poly(A) polymerase